MGKRIKLQQTEPETSKTVLVESIVDIGKAAKNLNESGLNEDAIVTLLHRQCRVSSRGDIIRVLDGLRQLESWYCK